MKKLKRFLFFFIGIIIIMFAVAAIGGYIWIDISVKNNIKIAKQKYPVGKAEDALLAFLADSTNSPGDRSQLAIWTLGQIRSEKAIPVLKKLYKNDPEGKTCKGKHNIVLCQYEIYKALHAEEVNWWPLHSRLNK
jgi:hypothetical protein